MQTLTEMALERADCGAFTLQEVSSWLDGSQERRSGLLKRALAAGEVVRIHRGLYILAGKYLRGKVDPMTLAQRIHGPSYISLEAALSRRGWIPEAVYTITSASTDRAREFDTPLGRFSFTRIPQKTFYAGVDHVEQAGSGNADGTGYGGGRGSGSGFADGSGYGGPLSHAGVVGSFLLASPLKALADYVYAHKCDWVSARPVVESLRVDEGCLAGIPAEDFEVLESNYSSRRVRRFLDGLRRELGK
jgi:hypothetical protein